MESTPQLDCAGRRRSPATLASFHRGLPPRNKGLRISARSAAGRGDHRGHARGRREPRRRTAARHHRRAVACRPANQRGTRAQRDRSRPGRGSLVVRHGKGDKRREVGMDRWAWAHLEPWLELRRELPVGRLFCVLRGPTRGRPCSPAGIRAQLQHAAALAGVRRRFAPHQLRHAHAVEMSREGISLLVIQRQLGHADLAITSRYLRGIDNTEIIAAVHERPAPMIPADPHRVHR